MALLPTYCADTMGFKYGDSHYNTSPRAPGWVAQMGNSFWAMHHYCWALINVHRARFPGVGAAQRRGLLESAIGDIGYVLKNSPPDFIMLPELYLRIGEISMLLGHTSQASDAYAKARELKPDYWPAYAQWAEVLIKLGMKDKAAVLLREGLSRMPQANVLQKLYRSIGGDPASIPVREAATDSKPAPEPASVASSAASAGD